MKQVFELNVETSLEDFEGWLLNEKMEELSIVTSMMPEEHFHLKKIRKTADHFVIDGERVSFNEEDGQEIPEYRQLTEVIRIDARMLENGMTEVIGKVQNIVGLEDELENYMRRFTDRIGQVFPPPSSVVQMNIIS